jgi:hypothetical protein
MNGLISIREIIGLVAMTAEIDPSVIEGHSRMKAASRARQIAMWLAHRAGASSPTIAAGFSERDHTTVLHGVKAIEAQRGTEPELKQLLDRLADVIDWKMFAASAERRDPLDLARSIYVNPRRAGMAASVYDIHALATIFLRLWDLALAAEALVDAKECLDAIRRKGLMNLTDEDVDARDRLRARAGALATAITDEMAALRGETNEEEPG